MNTTTRRRALATLLTSAALLTPSFAFAGVEYEDVDAIPDVLSIFGGSDSKPDPAKAQDDANDDTSEEHAEAKKKASSSEDASR